MWVSYSQSSHPQQLSYEQEEEGRCSGSLHDNVAPCESSDSDRDINLVVHLSSDSSLDDSGDEWLDDEDLMSGRLCLCGGLNRAHKAYCHMSSRN